MCALWRQEINTGIFFIHSAHFLVCPFIYLFICLLIIWWVGVLLVCIPVQHHIPCSRGTEEGIRYAGTGATGSREPPCGFQKPNPGPLGEHLVLLAADSSLTHPRYVLRPVSHWTWSLPFRVHWLASKSPETFCSYLSSCRVADTCHGVLGTHAQAVTCTADTLSTVPSP